MHLTAAEEYGVRCLLQVARRAGTNPCRIQDVAAAEGLSPEYAAKLMRLLREGHLVRSTRGARGGYQLARDAASVTLWQVLHVLGGPFFPESFCHDHSAGLRSCVHSTDCSIRSLWSWISAALQEALERVTLQDLLREESGMKRWLADRWPRPATPPLAACTVNDPAEVAAPAGNPLPPRNQGP